MIRERIVMAVLLGGWIFVLVVYYLPAMSHRTDWKYSCVDRTIRQASSTDGKTQTLTITCEVKQ